ncbi:HtaA domain-containing protein [Microbacterium sp. 179-I 1D1 NHS]|uniref:HtaA domain-containing protein n=1 Tax=Microbacterium sp. 179-I 1D1 NHS TaxID=3374298 RepID=UPI00387A01E8
MQARHLGVNARSAILMIALAAALLPATALPAQAAPRTCTVSEAKVVWNAGASDVQASGSVTADDGTLTFEKGKGVLEPVAPAGSVSFDGSLDYTNAAGVATTLSAPTLVLDGEKGSLLFDAQPEGAEQMPQAPLATIDLGAAAVSESADTVNLDGVAAATEPTAEGRDVLWSGAAGTLDLTVVATCTTAEPAAAPVDDEEDAGGTGILVPVIVVGVAALLATLLAVGSVQRRKRNSARAAQPEMVDDPRP